MKRGDYTFSFDTAFSQVVRECAAKRGRNWHNLTWITPRMMALYESLHHMGFAHSFEVWNRDGKLVGGGFGIAVGRVFYSESLFSREKDTSKIASSALFYHLARWGYAMCDGRDYTPMQSAMGFRLIPRSEHESVLSQHSFTGGNSSAWATETDLKGVAAWVASLGKKDRTKAAV
jgi:leucyl/phenylalanyl-tRNA--protein transferase